ncbi:uncharacterized protein LOC144341361 [Macaca mulatta]
MGAHSTGKWEHTVLGNGSPQYWEIGPHSIGKWEHSTGKWERTVLGNGSAEYWEMGAQYWEMGTHSIGQWEHSTGKWEHTAPGNGSTQYWEMGAHSTGKLDHTVLGNGSTVLGNGNTQYWEMEVQYWEMEHTREAANPPSLLRSVFLQISHHLEATKAYPLERQSTLYLETVEPPLNHLKKLGYSCLAWCSQLRTQNLCRKPWKQPQAGAWVNAAGHWRDATGGAGKSFGVAGVVPPTQKIHIDPEPQMTGVLISKGGDRHKLWEGGPMRTGAEVEPCGHRPGPPGATEAGRGGNLLSAQALISDFWPPKP